MEIIIGLFIVALALLTAFVAIGPANLRHMLARFIPSLDPQYLTCRIIVPQGSDETEKTESELSDDPIRQKQPPVFQVQICGQITAPRKNCPTEFIIRLEDITGHPDCPKPVLSKNPEYHSPNSPAFEYHLDNGILPARRSILNDWVTLLEFPANLIFLPRMGLRDLQCVVTVIDCETGKQLACAKGCIEVQSTQAGYENIQQENNEKRIIIARLCCGFWNACGRSEYGREHLTQWIQQTFTDENTNQTLIQMLNQPDNAGLDSINILQQCHGLVEFTAPNNRLVILELLVQIASASEFVPASQARILMQTAKIFEISEERFSGLVQKYLAGNPRRLENPEWLLGIHEDMTEHQVVEILTQQYKKWNSRVTNTDPEIRKQADQMLDLITELRSRCSHQSCV